MEIPLEDKIEIRNIHKIKIKSLINGYFCFQRKHTVLFDLNRNLYRVLPSKKWLVGDFKIALSAAANPDLTFRQWSYNPNISGRKIKRIRIVKFFLNYMDSCHWCKKKFDFNFPEKITIEHIKPISKGGSLHLNNLTLACAKCNNSRSNHEDYFKNP